MSLSLTKKFEEEVPEDLESRFQKALEFYRERGSVLFVSEVYRFFESHGFVQQSLAKTLTDNGIKVQWIDSIHTRGYQPTLNWKSELFKLSQLPKLPLIRYDLMDHWNVDYQASHLKSLIKKMGNPLLWIQSGLDDRVVGQLDNVDIFSVFDDPHRHTPHDALCQKSKLIVCQNQFAANLIGEVHPDKTRVILPPVDMDYQNFTPSNFQLPKGFPEKRMGYLGTFFPDSFDMVMLEDFIRSYPDWGFVFLGRTNADGQRYINYFKRYSNFHYLGWAPRDKVKEVWQLLDVCLLLYRPSRISDGAYPTKILEASQFGVPCVATSVPKTSSLEGIVPRSSFANKLKEMALEAVKIPPKAVENLRDKLILEMHPKMHLTRVAEFLR